MKKLIKVERINDIISAPSGAVTATDYWGLTNNIKLIRMKDDSFVLGIDIEYVNSKNNRCVETYPIQVDEKGVPYVEFGEDSRFFTKENCKEDISHANYLDGSHKHIVHGFPIHSFEESLNTTKSVFNFVGSCVNSDNVQKYFSRKYHVVGLSGRGLAILAKYVENPENKEVIEKRLQKPTAKEVLKMQDEINNLLKKFYAGQCGEWEVISKVRQYNTVVNEKYSMKADECIQIDLSKYEYLLDKNPNQPGNN